MTVRVIRHDEGVVELLLDDPDRGNALDLTAAEALRAAAAEVAGDPGRAVLLRPAGDTFCVGGDLRAFARRDGDTGRYVHSTALALAVEFAERPTEAFTAAKQLLSAGERNALGQHLEEEARLIAALADGEPARTRITSFLPARIAGRE
jgi:2-(1,2-epoxy-1,2-dihydrophenyl)acetyl-CoA isomerase